MKITTSYNRGRVLLGGPYFVSKDEDGNFGIGKTPLESEMNLIMDYHSYLLKAKKSVSFVSEEITITEWNTTE